MINDELLSLEQVLVEIENISDASVKFKYAMAKNKKIVKEECDAIRITNVSSKDFINFDNERVNINVKYCIKDKDNKPTIQNNKYIIDPKSQKLFEKELKELQEKYSEAILKETERRIEYNQFLRKEVSEEVVKKLNTIKYEDIPRSLTQKQIEFLLDLIVK